MNKFNELVAEERRLYTAMDEAKLDGRIIARQGGDTAPAIKALNAANAAWYEAHKAARAEAVRTLEALDIHPGVFKAYLP